MRFINSAFRLTAVIVFTAGCKGSSQSRMAQLRYGGADLQWTKVQLVANLMNSGVKVLTSKDDHVSWSTPHAMYSAEFGETDGIQSINCVAGVCEPIHGITLDMDLRAITDKLGEPANAQASGRGYLYTYQTPNAFFFMSGGRITEMGITAPVRQQ